MNKPNKNELEKRILAGKLTLRAADKGTNSPGSLMGYAAVFGSRSQDLGDFVEMLCAGRCGRAGCRGAFTNALEKKQDVRFLLNHDANVVLGRTKNGTLKLSQDTRGLCFDVALPNTQAGRDVHAMVSDGLIDQCSFAFKVDDDNGGESWDEETDSRTGKKQRVRTVHGCNLFDASVVTYPAYLDTSVGARNLGAHYHVTAAPGVLVDEADRDWIRQENARKMGIQIADDDARAYLNDVAANDRPRTIDPLTEEIRKAERKANARK
jgi:HK97 family phage prohead protease